MTAQMNDQADQHRAVPAAPAAVPSAAATKAVLPHELFINRELSWLEFNARVLDEASNPAVPIYERLKFLAIFATNLDEFFMVRAAGLLAQLSGEVEEVPPDGLTPQAQLEVITRRAHELVALQGRVFNDHVRVELRRTGVALVKPSELDHDELARLDAHFERDIFPVLTPIAIDPVHPFPHLRNKTINVGILFERGQQADPLCGLVQVPRALPRLIAVKLKDFRRAFVTLEELILRHRQMIFPQMRIVGHYAFRVTRNFDIEVDEDEAEDLLISLQAELLRRERGHAVRLEVSGELPEGTLDWLCDELDLKRSRDVYQIDGPLFLGDMTALTSGDDRRELCDEPFSPQYVPPFRECDDFFETIRKGDVLLHHPYESFEAVVDFLLQAAEDPHVLAIKQTLYRTGGESPMVRALQRAAELGKQVTALVELKARFDEESNIQWARTLERSGVNVMYGLLGFKTHAKVLLVIRKEASGLRRYVHLATGNYNQQTARLYEDISLFTARDDVGEDATALFNLLTGYSTPRVWKRLIVAPLGLHEAVLGLINREANNKREGRKARIVAKLNALVDADVIAALYAASQAGVKIDLLVRGICCLRPGLPKISENIRVRALVDRFLEHGRILYFENAGDPEVYCSSADWMPRNFRRRVEVMFPVVDPMLRKRLSEEILATMQGDTIKSWKLESNGSYQRVGAESTEVLRSQQRFMDLARERAREPDYLERGTQQLVARSRPSELDKLRPKTKKKRKSKKE